MNCYFSFSHLLVPPSPPNITSITVLSSSSISFVWSAPLDDGGSPVTAYLIEYRLHANQSAAYMTTTLSATQLVHTLSNLLPYTEYDIKVGGVNIAGTGNRSGALEPPPRTHADCKWPYWIKTIGVGSSTKWGDLFKTSVVLNGLPAHARVSYCFCTHSS